MLRVHNPVYSFVIQELEQNKQKQLAEQKVPNKPFVLVNIPYIPPQVLLKDLQANQKLLSDPQIVAAKKYIKKDGKVSKSELKKHVDKTIGFSVAKIGNRYFAIYRGFQQNKELGSGSFGLVKLANDLETGEWCALKITKLQTQEEKNELQEWKGTFRGEELEQALEDKANLDKNEIAILDQLRQLKGNYKKDKWDGSTQSSIIMQWHPGVNLGTFTERGKTLPTVCWIDIIINTLKATQELHQTKVLSRDLKPKNIIYTPDRQIKLIDFGLSTMTSKDSLEIKEEVVLGTDNYMSPEIKSDNIYNEKTEVYALGMTFAEILQLTEGRYIKKLINKDHPNFISNTIIDNAIERENILNYLRKMLTDNPGVRPTIAEALVFFQTLRERKLDVLSKIMHNGYIHVQDYLTANDEDKQEMLKALALLDEVTLIDNQQRNVFEYIRVKNELAAADIFVVPQVVLYDSKSALPDILKNYSDDRAKNRAFIFNDSFISTFQRATAPLPQQLTNVSIQPIPLIQGSERTDYIHQIRNKRFIAPSPMHIRQICYALLKELKRLRIKYNNNNEILPRVQAIQNVLTDVIYHDLKKTLTYQSLYSMLIELQNKMQATRHFYSSVLSFFGIRSQAQSKEVIDNIITNIYQQTLTG